MTRFVSLKLGQIVQNGLNVSNPLQDITWYIYTGRTTDEAGTVTQQYNQMILKARVQSVTHNVLFKYNLELGNVYKRFYVLTDTFQTTNRNISSDGDFIKYNGLFYRVLEIPDEFLTGWQQIIGVQSDLLED